MRIDYSKNFLKTLKKSPKKIKDAFKLRLSLFVGNHHNPVLNNHLLRGRWMGYRSINVTGDWRAIFTEEDNYNWVKFHGIGTHSRLYG